MSPPIAFEGVWKKFRRGERHDSLRDLIPALGRRFFTPRSSTALSSEEFWAVQDLSFTVARGEGLAIIGPNGAGKSTTLKILTRIMKPTRGTSLVRGRVGALIEIAAGFHPDLTGKENVYLQGAIMGMKRTEIAARFDEIVAFAGVEQFVDTPVKRYSSGMNARLGFSIAAHLEPDVLIIDEILSVGDMAFQQKCIDRMTTFKRQGTAVVFVTHNLQAAATHFDRGLVMSAGQAVYCGPAPDAVRQYAQSQGTRRLEPDRLIVGAQLLDTDGRVVQDAVPGQRLCLRVDYQLPASGEDGLVCGLFVTDVVSGVRLYNAHSHDLGLRPTWRRGQRVTVEFWFTAHLLRGTYNVNCHLSNMLTHESLAKLEPAASLQIHETYSQQGTTDLEVSCRIVDAATADADRVPAGTAEDA